VGAGLHRDLPQSAFGKSRALVMLGMPGAGKGTQAHEISREFGVPEMSTGAILREAVEQKTPLGLAVQPIMESGELVPDRLVAALVEERIGKPDCARGFVLDGFPRNLDQASFLDQLLQARDWGTVQAVYIHVDPGDLFKRLTGRRECPSCGLIYNIYLNPPRQPGVCDKDGTRLIQRKDDSEEAIRKRFKEFESQTRPLIDQYRERNLLYEVDGSREPRIVTEQIFRLLRER
jgi:adenylate kinase